jgi:hypothetical protein
MDTLWSEIAPLASAKGVLLVTIGDPRTDLSRPRFNRTWLSSALSRFGTAVEPVRWSTQPSHQRFAVRQK